MSKTNEKPTMTMEVLQGVIAESVAKAIGAVDAKLEGLEGSVESVAKEVSKSTDDKGINQTRLIMAEMKVAKARKEGTLGNLSDAEAVLMEVQKHYGKSDPVFVKRVEEAAKDLAVSGNGGQIVIEEFANGFLSQLWDATVFNKLGVRFLPTKSGNLTLAKIVSGPAAQYIGELGTVDTSTIVFGQVSLSLKKLMALVPVSNDLLRYSHLNVAKLVRDEIIHAMAEAMEHAFLFGKGDQYQPLGLINVPGHTKLKNKMEATRETGINMRTQFIKKNHGTNGLVWIMGVDTYQALLLEVVAGQLINKDELEKGLWLGYPVHLTNKITNSAAGEDLFLLKPADMTAIEGLNISIRLSEHASFSAGNGAVINMFTNDMTLYQGIAEHDWKLNYPSSLVTAKINAKIVEVEEAGK